MNDGKCVRVKALMGGRFGPNQPGCSISSEIAGWDGLRCAASFCDDQFTQVNKKKYVAKDIYVISVVFSRFKDGTELFFYRNVESCFVSYVFFLVVCLV